MGYGTCTLSLLPYWAKWVAWPAQVQGGVELETDLPRGEEQQRLIAVGHGHGCDVIPGALVMTPTVGFQLCSHRTGTERDCGKMNLDDWSRK